MVPSNRESNQFQFDAPAEMNGISYLLYGPEFDNEPIYGGFEEDDDDEIEYPTTLELPTEHRKVETDAANLSYGDQLVAEPFRLKSKPLMFARTAKRIDVQKLKENLWSKLADDHDTPKVIGFDIGIGTCGEKVYRFSS
jgi:condensin complex subunit 2